MKKKGRGGAHERQVARPDRYLMELEWAKIFGGRLGEALPDPAYAPRLSGHWAKYHSDED